MGIEQMVPGGRGEEFFREMRAAVDGKKAEAEQAETASEPVKKAVKPEQKIFTTGAGAMDEWQRQQEEIEEKRSKDRAA
jgi:hypothetical protein